MKKLELHHCPVLLEKFLRYKGKDGFTAQQILTYHGYYFWDSHLITMRIFLNRLVDQNLLTKRWVSAKREKGSITIEEFKNIS